MVRWTDDLTGAVVRRLHPEQRACPLCGSTHTVRAEENGRYVGWREWECRNCGAGFHED